VASLERRVGELESNGIVRLTAEDVMIAFLLHTFTKAHL